MLLVEALASPGGAMLRHLDLSDNRLGLDVFGQPSAQVARALALALPCRTRLGALNLARNELGSAAVAELAAAIPASVGLQRLSLVIAVPQHAHACGSPCYLPCMAAALTW